MLYCVVDKPCVCVGMEEPQTGRWVMRSLVVIKDVGIMTD